MSWQRTYHTTDSEIEAFENDLVAEGYRRLDRMEFEILRVEAPEGDGPKMVYRNSRGRESWHPDLFQLFVSWRKQCKAAS